MKKRIFALCLALTLCLSLFVGCASTSGASPSASASAKPSASASPASGSSAPELKPFKIGMPFVTSTDPITLLEKRQAEVICKAAGGEVVWEPWNFSPDTLITALQNLKAAGCAGITFMPTSPTIIPAVAKFCDENNMFWSTTGIGIGDPAAIKVAEASKYYVGSNGQDYNSSANKAIQTLVDKGCKNLALITFSPDQEIVKQYEAQTKAVLDKNPGVKLLTTAYGNVTAEQVTKSTESVIATYPEVDGIMFFASVQQGCYAAFSSTLQRLNRNDIKFALIDSVQDVLPAVKSGQCVAAYAEATLPSMIQTFALLVNAIQGTPLFDKAPQLTTGPFDLSDPNDFSTFFDKIVPGTPFNEAACQKYFFKFMPGSTVTGDSFKSTVDNITMDFLIKNS